MSNKVCMHTIKYNKINTGNEDKRDLLIPDNIPDIQDMSVDEELTFFQTPLDIYLGSFRTIRKCERYEVFIVYAVFTSQLTYMQKWNFL